MPEFTKTILLAATAAAVSVCSPSTKGGDTNEGKGVSLQTGTEHQRTNRLIHATSPYLRQHAHNPVDWYEWGREALGKAEAEDKPIFLSIGYSACHWCHVMAHESFEDDAIAKLLNKNFVAIKVDREERPDIDEIYMRATVGMTGRGGWPMSVFLTPDGKPFVAGTYYPRDHFEQLLVRIAEMWRDDRAKLLETGGRVHEYLKEWAGRPSAGDDLIPEDALQRSAEQMSRYFDMQLGAFQGNGNKFPPSMWMEFMLRRHRRTGDNKLLEWVELTLTKMAQGGIYDHLGGGICRYSTDPRWLVPHFEKMLYDQAMVSGIYLDAYQVTGDPRFERTARGILDYVIGDLQSPEGGFYSTRDADSEGMEGKYYIWTVEQVNEVLGPDDAKLFCAYYDVTETGNWFESRGHAPPGPKNILNVQRSVEAVAKLHDVDPKELKKRLAEMRRKLLDVRSQRVPPGLDDKILTGWNGLMIASLAKGARVLDEPRYAESAVRAADFVLKNLRKDGKLLRTYRDGRAHLTGYLSDYAFFSEGLLNLYDATFDPRWIRQAVALTDDLIARYHDPQGGGFFFTASDGERLLTRTKNADDGAIPSGNSVAAMNLLRLAILVNNPDYRAKAESIFRAFAPLVKESPGAFERLLCAVDFYYDRPKEVAIVGAPASPDTRAMSRAVFGKYRPNKIVAFAADKDAAGVLAKAIPLLRGKRRIDGKTTGYVCQNYRCKKPVTSVADFAAALDGK